MVTRPNISRKYLLIMTFIHGLAPFSLGLTGLSGVPADVRLFGSLDLSTAIRSILGP